MHKFNSYKPVIILSIILLLAVSGICKDKYSADWESLKTHQNPEWYLDAKLGIYTHWGVYCVPAFGNEWYPRKMFTTFNSKRGNYFKHHQETWGKHTEFSYKDFVPMFTAEKFDAKEWAELFKATGAKFAGPVAEHHDGFAMWDSKYTEWDAFDKGPKRDIVGELEKEIKKLDMKFVASLHHARKWWYYETSYKLAEKRNEKYDTQDPKYAGAYKIYPPVHDKDEAPTTEYMKAWHEKTIEIIDKYSPDMLWFDSGLEREKFWRGSIDEFDEYKKDFMAHYYNHADKNDKEVCVIYKDKDFPVGTAIIDIERGRMGEKTDYPWMTDTSIDKVSWCRVKNSKYKSVNEIVDILVDIVSKNGCMLLNVAPKADGSIPEEQKNVMLGIGKWLKVNGEAIYSTRPWKINEEGPTKFAGGMFSERKSKVSYTFEDVRFTKSKDGKNVYAIVLDWPESGNTITIKSINTNAKFNKKNIAEIQLLGSKKKLKWTINSNGLTINLPKKKPCENAFSFKIMINDK